MAGDTLFIRDVGANLGSMSVTNDAEAVVQWLMQQHLLRVGMKLGYYDSRGELDEITFDERGFTGFRSGKQAEVQHG